VSSRTMEVSIATPRGDIPSIHSQIRTTISEPPGQIITHDVNRLLQYLHEITAQRDQQHGELTEHIRAIEDELLDLSDYLRLREDFAPASPSIPVVDEGIASVSQSARATPLGPRAPSSQPQLTTISLPPGRRIPSPSSVSSSMSFLSSHHSDDFSLYGESQHEHVEIVEEQEEHEESSYSWPSSDSSDEDMSSFVSSDLSSQPVISTPEPTSSSTSGEYLSSTSDEIPLSVPPPISPTPTDSSISTVRGPELSTLSNLHTLLEGLREQTAALAERQNSTNEMLDELRGRSCDDVFHRIEVMLQSIIDRCEVHPPQETVETVESVDESVSEASSGNLRSRLEQLLRRRHEQPLPIHQPTPVRASRSDDLFPDFLAPQMPAATAVSQPPLLVPFTYQSAPRPTRSVSPTLPSRPTTVPILPSMTTIHIPPRAPRSRPHQRPARGYRPSEPAAPMVDESRYEREPNFLDRVRQGRQGRQPGSDGFYQGLEVFSLS
jgi:hypothetical protein